MQAKANWASALTKTMSYSLKRFDTQLLKFNIASGGIKGLSVELIEIDEKHRSLLPIDLELTDKGLLQWLKRRIIPKNRAFAQRFLAKLGLNVNDAKGIIERIILYKTGTSGAANTGNEPYSEYYAFQIA